MRRLTPEQARRIAIRAQGLDAARPARIGPATLSRAVSRLGVLQLDSVNVFERSHYLPLLARLGPYRRSALDELLRHDQDGGLGEFTEYVAHEACVMPVADWPLWAWHREASIRDGFRSWGADNTTLLDEVRSEFAERGPLRVSELSHPDNVSRGGGWWNRNDVHWAATYLFRRGELVVVGRRRFERRLALAEQVLPSEALRAVPADEAVVELVRRAARSYGVATLDDLADHPRLRTPTVRPAVERLVAEGELDPVRVEGWDRPAFLASGTPVPRCIEAAALLSPFDPLVWYRPRAERLFGFRYRISIYTPKAQREHGYYVLPVLIDDQLVGRLDLKSDRRVGVLRVQHAHLEPAQAARSAPLAGRVATLLHEAAAWQGLGETVVSGPGGWAADLARAL